jgi:hypothetical protein
VPSLSGQRAEEGQSTGERISLAGQPRPAGPPEPRKWSHSERTTFLSGIDIRYRQLSAVLSSVLPGGAGP